MKKFVRPSFTVLARISILVFSDFLNRRGAGNSVPKTRIAVSRFNSNQLQEETEKGLMNKIQTSKEFLKGIFGWPHRNTEILLRRGHAYSKYDRFQYCQRKVRYSCIN